MSSIGTLRVVELAEGHEVGLMTCEGGGVVVGVVTLLVRGGAQVLHGDQVVELSVPLEVHEREEEEDSEEQTLRTVLTRAACARRSLRRETC